MINQLPGDNITQGEAEELAEKAGCPASNICRYCGEEILVMAFTMTGSCCVNHEKLRYNPNAFTGADYVPKMPGQFG